MKSVSFCSSTVSSDDDLDGSKLVAKAILEQDQENLVAPVPVNPNWMPEEPSDIETFDDAAFLDRVDPYKHALQAISMHTID